MQSTQTISLLHYRRAGDVADYILARCRVGEWDNLSIDELCKQFATCESVLTRSFKQRFAITIHSFIIHERMDFAKKLIVTTELPIKEIATLAGFCGVANFSRDFARYTGVSPQAYRHAHMVSGLPADAVFF